MGEPYVSHDRFSSSSRDLACSRGTNANNACGDTSSRRSPCRYACTVRERTTLPLPAISNGEIPPLTYSAHVYTSDEAKRSVTLNGMQFREGDSPIEGLTIEQIQQDMTIFSVEGEVFILEALEDWPGGKFNENERSADDESGSAAP
nr:type II secretion system assembly factor GspB [Pectobacterium colocasium]